MNILTYFASEAAGEEGGIFGALGIDWTTLILQVIAFGILVFIIAKWIYPPIAAMLDRHDKLIEDSVKAAKTAEENAQNRADEAEKALNAARDEARDIVETARAESADLLVNAEADAAKKADAIVASARAQLDQDIESARRTLRDETANLVATATEKIIRVKIDDKTDEKLIKDAIRSADGKE